MGGRRESLVAAQRMEAFMCSMRQRAKFFITRPFTSVHPAMCQKISIGESSRYPAPSVACKRAAQQTAKRYLLTALIFSVPVRLGAFESPRPAALFQSA